MCSSLLCWRSFSDPNPAGIVMRTCLHPPVLFRKRGIITRVHRAPVSLHFTPSAQPFLLASQNLLLSEVYVAPVPLKNKCWLSDIFNFPSQQNALSFFVNVLFFTEWTWQNLPASFLFFTESRLTVGVGSQHNELPGNFELLHRAICQEKKSLDPVSSAQFVIEPIWFPNSETNNQTNICPSKKICSVLSFGVLRVDSLCECVRAPHCQKFSVEGSEDGIKHWMFSSPHVQWDLDFHFVVQMFSLLCFLCVWPFFIERHNNRLKITARPSASSTASWLVISMLSALMWN